MDSTDLNLSKLLEIVKYPMTLQSMGSQRVRHGLGTEQQQITVFSIYYILHWKFAKMVGFRCSHYTPKHGKYVSR